MDELDADELESTMSSQFVVEFEAEDSTDLFDLVEASRKLFAPAVVAAVFVVVVFVVIVVFVCGFDRLALIGLSWLSFMTTNGFFTVTPTGAVATVGVCSVLSRLFLNERSLLEVELLVKT